MFSVVLIISLILLLLLIWASADIRSRVYVNSLCSVNCKEKKVAITFDDGPSQNTKSILEVLDRYNAKATFFLVGEKALNDVESVKSIVNKGHSVANHSWSHSSLLPIKPVDDITKELLDTNKVLFDITGKENIYFRPPFGVTNPLIAKSIKRTNMVSVGWSIRSFDTISWLPRRIICKRVVRKAKSGDIILLHDRVYQADVLLENVLNILHNKGFVFVTVDEL